MNLPCKIVLNQGVIAAAEATNKLLQGDDASFSEEAIRSMIDLDLGYMTAKHLLQSEDEKTRWLVAKFNADVTARAMMHAADRVGDLESGKL